VFACPIGGASISPARILGPDTVGSDYMGWWVNVGGPVIGGPLPMTGSLARESR
jgi:hypothetical protein